MTNDDAMDGIKTLGIHGVKRPRNVEETNESDESTSSKAVNQDVALRISFVNLIHNFIDVSWVKCCEFINTISVNWQFLTFGQKHKTALITCSDLKEISVIKDLKAITVDNIEYPIIVQNLAQTSKKGIIFNRILSVINEEQINEALKSQGITNYFRIQRTNSLDGTKSYTGSIILNFNGEIPSHLELFKIKLSISILTPRVLFCYHCGLLGHTQQKCIKKDRSFCSKCFFDHQSNEKCIINCKQCQGNHVSSDINCPVLIKEVQIMKIKEAHDLNYFDAKAVFSTINQPAKLDLIDEAKIKIQELHNKSNFLYASVKKLSAEKNNLISELKDKNEEIIYLKNTVEEQKNTYVVELQNLTTKTLDMHDKLKESLECNSDTIAELRELKTKFDTAEKSMQKLIMEKNNDTKFLEGFLASQDVILNAYIAYTDKKKNPKVHQLSLDIKIPKSRSNSVERRKI